MNFLIFVRSSGPLKLYPILYDVNFELKEGFKLKEDFKFQSLICKNFETLKIERELLFQDVQKSWSDNVHQSKILIWPIQLRHFFKWLILSK